MNTNFARVKRPISFKLVWPVLHSGDTLDHDINNIGDSLSNDAFCEGDDCSIWFPEAPKGYVALGCVVSPGRTQPPLSSAFCISASLVCSCSLRDCITINTTNSYVVFSDLHTIFYVLCLLRIRFLDSNFSRYNYYYMKLNGQILGLIYIYTYTLTVIYFI